MTIQYVVPVGGDNFRKLITVKSRQGYKSIFVDKTMFIAAILDDA